MKLLAPWALTNLSTDEVKTKASSSAFGFAPLPYELHATFDEFPGTPTFAGPFQFSGYSSDTLSMIRIHWDSDLPPARVNQAEAWYMGSLGADYVNKVFVKKPASLRNANDHYHLITFTGLTLNNGLSTGIINQQNVDLNNGNMVKSIIQTDTTYPLGTPFQGAHTITHRSYEVLWDIATEESSLVNL